MKDDSTAMGTAFARWQKFTDDYALALRALERGDADAAANLARLAQELHVCGEGKVMEGDRNVATPQDSTKPAAGRRTSLRDMFGFLRAPKRNSARP